jgi:asparagine synthase (glutamine-hydrolysing)
MLINKDNSFTVSRYWQLSNHNYNNIVDVREKLQNEMKQSVKRHMVADVPVSSFLSGGLDSSLISVLAQKSNNSLRTYTIKTLEKDNKYEKMPLDYEYAKKLSGEKNFVHNEIEVKADIITELPFIIKMLDEPIGDPAAINTYLICKAAQEKGVKVLLSGIGADEIFFGYRRQKATLLAQKYRKVPEIIRKGITNIINYLPVRGKNKGYKIRRWIKRFNSFANLPLEKSYMKSYSYYSDKELESLFVEKYHVGINQINNEHEKIFNEEFANDTVNQICNTDIQMFMLGLNLSYTDRASMAASVEVRVPFIDKNVIEFAMKIPGKYKYKNGVSKYILKKAAEGIIPKKIIYRKKASFGAPIRAWVSNDLRDMIDVLLSEENIVKRGFFNYEFVKRIIEDDRDGKSDNAYRIYQLLTIELWCREYLDK